MKAGKRRLAGDTARAATTDEVKDLPTISRRSWLSKRWSYVFSKKAWSGMGATKNEVSVTRQALFTPQRGPHLSNLRSSGWPKKATCQRVNIGQAGHPSHDVLCGLFLMLLPF